MLDGWRVGIALPGDASVMQIGSATEKVLSDPTFADEARMVRVRSRTVMVPHSQLTQSKR